MKPACRGYRVYAPLVTGLLALLVGGTVAAHDHSPANPEVQDQSGHEAHALPAIDADDPHAAHEHQDAAASKAKLARIDIPANLSLTNRRGDRMDLRRDVIGDRVAVVNFVYTSCTTVCPVTSSIFTMVQRNLGDRVGEEVTLITITVDPTRDTPHRLHEFSKSFNPGRGWIWLTGDKGTVDIALRAFGAYTPSFEDHPAMVLIGDESRGEWLRLYGFPAPEMIESRVRELLEKRSS